MWVRVPFEFTKEIILESKGIHKDYPGHEIIRFSSCRGFVFSAFLYGRRGRGLAVEPVASNRKSMVAGQARQHAAAADICADKLTLYKSSPRAAKRRFFFAKTRQKAHQESRACALALARPRPGLATCPRRGDAQGKQLLIPTPPSGATTAKPG